MNYLAAVKSGQTSTSDHYPHSSKGSSSSSRVSVVHPPLSTPFNANRKRVSGSCNCKIFSILREVLQIDSSQGPCHHHHDKLIQCNLKIKQILEDTKTPIDKRLKTAWDEIEGIHQSGIQPSSYLYNTILSTYINKQNLDKNGVHRVLTTMNQAGVKPGQATFSCLINFYIRKDKENKVIKIFEILKNTDLQLNSYILRPLVMFFTKKCNRVYALKIFNEMKDVELIPDVIAFNSLINMFAKKGDEENALKMYDEMKKNELSPDLFTFNILINLYAQKGDDENALKIYDEIERAGLRPCTITYDILINLYAQKGDDENALKMFDKLKAAGLSPIDVTFSTLINLYARRREVGKALEIFDKMKATGLSAYKIPFILLINLCAQRGYNKVALKIFDEMKKAGLNPDRDLYMTLLNMSAQKGDDINALKLFHEMEKAKLNPTDIIIFTMLIKLYAQKGDVNNALKIYNKMEAARLRPTDVTFNTLIKMFAQMGDDKNVFKMFDKMKKAGISPDEFTFNTMINLYAQKGDDKNALKMFEEMKAAGLKPTEVTFTTLISLYWQKSDQIKADKLFQEMQTEGYHDFVAYNLLIEFKVSSGNFHEAESLFEEMKQKQLWNKGPKKGKEDLIFDLHDLSHGCAYLWIRSFLNSGSEEQCYTIITGKGNHRKDSQCVMRDYIFENIRKYHKDFDCKIDSKNEGCLIVFRQKVRMENISISQDPSIVAVPSAAPDTATKLQIGDKTVSNVIKDTVEIEKKKRRRRRKKSTLQHKVQSSTIEIFRAKTDEVEATLPNNFTKEGKKTQICSNFTKNIAIAGCVVLIGLGLRYLSDQAKIYT